MRKPADVDVKHEIANPDYAERVRGSFDRQAFMHFIGAEMAEVAPGTVEIRLPYRAELAQQHGFFHGGIVGTVADNACGYASFSLAAADASVLTVEYKLNLMAPAAGDLLIARGRVLRPGRTLVVAQADVFAVREGREKQVATALATLMLMTGMADEPHAQETTSHKSPGMDGTP